jgi:uncharacterized membrane protein
MKNQKENIGVIVSFILVIGVIGLVIYFLMHRTPDVNPLEGIKSGTITDNAQGNQNTNQNSNPDTSANTGTPNTSQKNMDKVAKNGDTLVMNYTGRLIDGTVFD